MEIQRLFRKSIVLQISEIERVEIGKKNQLLLYASGKKLITIDFLTENYEYLEETLKRNGKYCPALRISSQADPTSRLNISKV